MMFISFCALVLDIPVEVRHAEIDGLENTRKLCVVDEHDAALMEQASAVDEIEKDRFEAVAAVDEGQIESPPLSEKARERSLGFLFIELHQVAHASLLKVLESNTSEQSLVRIQALELIGIDGDVMWVVPVGEQALE
jgi:hypothetical protein